MEVYTKKVIGLDDDQWKEAVVQAVQEMLDNYKENKEDLKNCQLISTTQLGKELEKKMSSQALNKFLVENKALIHFGNSNYILAEDFKKYGVQMTSVGIYVEDDMLSVHKSSSVKWNINSGIVEELNKMIKRG